MDADPTTCAECGRRQPAGNDFCSGCGAFLSWDAPEPERSPANEPLIPTGVSAEPWATALLMDMASNGLWLVVGYGGQRLWQRLRRRHRTSTPSAEEAERAAIQRVRLATVRTVKRKDLAVVRTTVPETGPAVVEVSLERMRFLVEVTRRRGRLEARIAETRTRERGPR